MEKEEAIKRDMEKRHDSETTRRKELEKELTQNRLRQDIERQMRKELQERILEDQMALKKRL